MRRLVIAATAAVAGLGAANPALAHCPLCSAATGGFLVAARAAGVSDIATGTLAGGFAVSTALWAHNWLKKRNKGKAYLPFQGVILVLASLLSTILGFQVVG